MKKKERELYRRIYLTCRGKVRAFLWKYFPGIRDDDTADVMQEVWAALGENISDMRKKSEAEILSWLFTVAKHAAVDWIRENSQKYQCEGEMKAQLELLRANHFLPEDAVDKMIAEEILRQLSQEELIFLENEFVRPGEKKKQNNAKTCRIYRLRKRLKEKMEEI